MKKKFTLLLITALIMVFAIPANAAVFSNDIRVLLSTAEYKSMDITINGDYYLKEAPDFDLSSEDISIWIEGNRPVIRTETDSFSAAAITLISPNFTGTEDTVGFYNANYGYRTYLGNMQFTAYEGSIRAINTLPTEHYLYGVVPYEMSNRFPLESLKAQAVCARSYAATKCAENRELSYDILDTVDHQVYWGFTASYARAISAVDATKGQVLTDNGAIIQAFYTASNGGQTELTGNVWNENLPYYVLKNDIFDLANPSSLEQKTFIPDDISPDTTSLMDDLVLSQLQTKADALAGENVTLLSVISVQPKEPTYAPPSKSFSKADVVLMVSGSGDSIGQITVPIIFDDLIHSQNNPNGVFNIEPPYLKMRGAEKGLLWDPVSQSSIDGWFLTNRRYGHGVGLSQRGAQQRATSGQDYRDILDFYYDQTLLINFIPSTVSDAVTSEKYQISANGVEGVNPGTSVEYFLASFSSSVGSISLIASNGQAKAEGAVATGDLLRCVYVDNSTIIDSPIIIYGDLNGDGALTNRDVNLLQWHILGTRPLAGAYLSAADVTHDGLVDSSDLLAMIWHLNGKKSIS